MNPLETKKAYQEYVDKKTPNSPILKNCFNAFWVGGLICTIGQIILNICKERSFDTQASGTIVSILLIGIAAFLTGLNRKICWCWFFNSYYWLCQLNCFSSNGIQIRRICNGCGRKNVYCCRSSTCIWYFSFHNCRNHIFNI